MVENTSYGTDDSVLERQLLQFEYDAVGNWIQRRIQHCLRVERSSALACKPHEVTYQSITYFRRTYRRAHLTVDIAGLDATQAAKRLHEVVLDVAQPRTARPCEAGASDAALHSS